MTASLPGHPDLNRLIEQYKDPSNLQARSSLHGRFQTNRYGWLRWIFDHFDFPPNARILDVGCGDAGLWTTQRARIVPTWRLTLADTSPGMIAEAQRILTDPPCAVRFAVADAQNLPFDDHSFDAVVANHMLYHVADLNRGLGEIRRVLRPAGRLYASTNGIDQMRELRDMVRPFAPYLPFTLGQTAAAFGLENGSDLLARHFDRIQPDGYPDSLEVTETEPLLAYILSVRGAKEALSPAAIADLRRRIDTQIAAAGSFHITKSEGIFTAIRPPTHA
jgi:SAM-dependent methyltransferase